MSDRSPTNLGPGNSQPSYGVSGVPWSPWLQARLYEWLIIDQYTLTIAPQTIAKASPDRQSLYVEHISGAGKIAMRLAPLDAIDATTHDVWPAGFPGILISSNVSPVLAQLEWLASSDVDSGCIIRVWELVSKY